MMARLAGLALLAALTAGCATTPPDPAAALLDPGERVELRIATRLLHGHDMQEPSYDAPEGYRPIPTYEGELLLTERRLLFVERSPGRASTLDIPWAAIARARPSPSPLLNYLVVWDAEGHADSFVVDARDVRALHQAVGRRLVRRPPGSALPARHELRDGGAAR